MKKSFLFAVLWVIFMACEQMVQSPHSDTIVPTVSRNSSDSLAELRCYKTLLQVVEDNYYGRFLLGSQLVQANVLSFDKSYGKHNTFDPGKLISQFDYIGLEGRLPQRKEGWLQKIRISGRDATILYMGKYIYVKAIPNNTVYRVPYTKLQIVNEINTAIEAIPLAFGDGLSLDGVFETNDGNFIAQCVNTDKSSPDYKTRYLYKVKLDASLNASIHFLFKCVESTINTCGVREHWSFKQYGSRILVTPYGGGRTGQAWWSEDYGDSFKCIFNIANETTFVATRPNGVTGFGAYGIHPLPGNLIPKQQDDFWDSISSIGNGNRHIHSGCFDEEFNRIWLVAGDDKYQVTGIYWSDDYGITWHRKSLFFNYSDIDKGRHSQMLQVVSLKNCVLFGTDGWGNGLFRYNRGKKEEEPEIEFVFAWSDNKTNLEGVANHNIVTDKGIILMIFAPDSKDYSPTGGVVASDGYHFKKVFLDTFNDNTLEGMKIGWTSFLSIHNDDLYIRTKQKNEIIVVEGFNLY